MNFNFTFLAAEWSPVHEAAAKAEALAELNALSAPRQHRAFGGEL